MPYKMEWLVNINSIHDLSIPDTWRSSTNLWGKWGEQNYEVYNIFMRMPRTPPFETHQKKDLRMPKDDNGCESSLNARFDVTFIPPGFGFLKNSQWGLDGLDLGGNFHPGFQFVLGRVESNYRSKKEILRKNTCGTISCTTHGFFVKAPK